MYRVVIAEDEDIIRKGLVYSIPWADMGCTVVGEAANGVEGVAAGAGYCCGRYQYADSGRAGNDSADI